MKAAAALALLLAMAAAGAAQARDSDPVAVGRYHLRKANQLAGEDHCHSAIHEYTLAYEKLKDPFVLFNRAECYRRIGQGGKAISDYRAFLEAVPAAPNRADVEAKISALAAPAPTAPAAPPAEPAVTAPPAPPPPPPTFTEPPHQPVVVLPPVEIQPPAREPSGPASPPAVLAQPAPAAPATETDSASGHGGHLWLWIALGAAVVGGAAGAYIALRAPATTPPPTDLGNYKF